MFHFTTKKQLISTIPVNFIKNIWNKIDFRESYVA